MIASVNTTVDETFAYVNFKVDGQEYRLGIEKNKLEEVSSMFGDTQHYGLTDKTLGFKVFFPAREVEHDGMLLKDVWDKLVNYGFTRK